MSMTGMLVRSDAVFEPMSKEYEMLNNVFVKEYATMSVNSQLLAVSSLLRQLMPEIVISMRETGFKQSNAYKGIEGSGILKFKVHGRNLSNRVMSNCFKSEPGYAQLSFRYSTHTDKRDEVTHWNRMLEFWVKKVRGAQDYFNAQINLASSEEEEREAPVTIYGGNSVIANTFGPVASNLSLSYFGKISKRIAIGFTDVENYLLSESLL